MTVDALYQLANATALAGWIALALFPRRPWANRWLCGVLLPGLFALAYLVALAWFWGTGEGGFSTLAGVMALFTVPGLVLVGWLHYLAFDLFVGAWQARRATAEALPYPLLLPCLVLTFLVGPVGLLLFLVLRRARGVRALVEA